MIEKKNKLHPKEAFKIAPFRKHIRKTRPHIHHGYLEIVYLYQGQGSHTIDDHRYEINTPSIFIVKNGQVHHWDLRSEPDGFVILIQKDFFPNCSDQELELLKVKLTQYEHIEITFQNSLTNLLGVLNEEYPTLNLTFFHSLLKTIFSKILEFATEPLRVKKHQTDYNTFFQQVEQYATKERKVSFYAANLNTTPQNLNSICKKCVGMAASEIISDVIIKEAKRQIKYTSLSISEVAYNMHFKDPSHFVKYFKRVTKQTPNDYRKQI
ncbi:helix-turn-helix transcriptional regulator [Halosquirtibacter xylanolyticus]|uniref:helix-turn-helix domain-containing protein n=1 Tax=Halosquirtibacter xylanolyticus TaxID=3374599 RepID=UPI0037481E24|nr:helix-turn-helix transcriptional regulator [Prolixibacteraceae bacterium]